ncbi:hypothetical protein F5141DRAFT_1065802 [Pisolithus sp. B1]|nr:hypothetical protein F5141DRAFT_1065802 [Pisolithus sp. B1]
MSSSSSAYLQSLYQQSGHKSRWRRLELVVDTATETVCLIQYCRGTLSKRRSVLDSLLTLDGEIRLLTRTKRWGLTHVLYIPTRYFPIIGTAMAVYTALVESDTKETSYSTLGWQRQKNICGVTDSSSAIANRLDKVTVGIFASAALFELVYTILYALRSQASTGRYTAGRLAGRRDTRKHAIRPLTVCFRETGMVFSLSESVLRHILGKPALTYRIGRTVNSFQGVLHGVLGSRILFDLQGALSQGISLQILTNAETRMDFASVPLSDLSANGF